MKTTFPNLTPRAGLARTTSTLLALCWLSGVTAACWRGDDSKKRKSQTARIVEIHLLEPPSEDVSDLRPGRFDQLEAMRAIYRAANDPAVRGIFLRLGSWHGAWAQAHEIGSALAFARSKSKPTLCHFDEIDNAGYGLAVQGCDSVGMTPAGMLNLVGVSVQSFYLKNLLTKIGVDAELVQIGKYKGAADPLTLDAMPPEVRGSLELLVEHIEQSLARAIVDGRKLNPAEAVERMHGGPYLASDAKALRLVDEVLFEDQHLALAKKKAGVHEVEFLNEPDEETSWGIRDVIHMFRKSGSDRDMKKGTPYVKLFRLTGTIMDGEEEKWQGAQAGPFVREMRRVADDENVRAVVIRIDSPGGSALASDRMWKAAYDVAQRKPVVISIGNMAASGGYYIASAGTSVWAEPASLVGSIGVVGGKINVKDLATRLGISTEYVERSKRASWLSPTRPLSPDEHDVLQKHLQATYDRFLQRIGTARASKMPAIAQAAEGRIMSGTQAQRSGLVDHIGGLADALRDARERGKLAANAPVQPWPPAPSVFDRVNMLLGGGVAAPVNLVRHSPLPMDPMPHAQQLSKLIASCGWFAPLAQGREWTTLASPYPILIE